MNATLLRFVLAILSSIELLDAAVLRLVTSLSHGIQRWIGWTSFRQAAVLVTWVLTTNVLDVTDYWLPDLLPGRQTGGSHLVLYAFGSFWLTWLRWRLCRADTEFSGDSDVLPASALMFHAAVTWPFRVLQLTLMPISIHISVNALWQGQWMSVVSYSGGAVMTLALYLSVVRPLRPGTTRLQEIAADIRAGFHVRSPIRSGGPA